MCRGKMSAILGENVRPQPPRLWRLENYTRLPPPDALAMSRCWIIAQRPAVPVQRCGAAAMRTIKKVAHITPPHRKKMKRQMEHPLCLPKKQPRHPSTAARLGSEKFEKKGGRHGRHLHHTIVVNSSGLMKPVRHKSSTSYESTAMRSSWRDEFFPLPGKYFSQRKLAKCRNPLILLAKEHLKLFSKNSCS